MPSYVTEGLGQKSGPPRQRISYPCIDLQFVHARSQAVTLRRTSTPGNCTPAAAFTIPRKTPQVIGANATGQSG
jgi:hypothetical protein